MIKSSNPVRMTIIYGILAAVSVYACQVLFLRFIAPSVVRPLLFLSVVCPYAVLLCRWYGANPLRCFFPFVFALTVALISGDTRLAILFSLAALAWIRTGLCFSSPLLRNLFIEITLIVLASAVLYGMFDRFTPISFAALVWLLFLSQSLYFVFTRTGTLLSEKSQAVDPYDSAYRAAMRILDGH